MRMMVYRMYLRGVPCCMTDPGSLIIATDIDKVKECFTELKQAKCVAFDFETTGLSPFGNRKQLDNELVAVSFAIQGGNTYAIPLYSSWNKDLEATIKRSIGEWIIGCEDTVKIAHNAKFDLLWGIERCCKPLYW